MAPQLGPRVHRSSLNAVEHLQVGVRGMRGMRDVIASAMDRQPPLEQRRRPQCPSNGAGRALRWPGSARSQP